MNKLLVSFDFWDTLVKNVSYKKERIEIICDFLKGHGYGYSIDDVRTAYGLIRQRIEQNKISDDNKYTCLEERISVVMDYLQVPNDSVMIRQLIKVLQEPVLKKPPPLMPYVKDLLQYLTKFAVIVCVSDTGMTSGDSVKYILDYYEIGGYFKYFIFSENIGYNKPDKRMFLQVINNAESVPIDRIYHVGNLFDTDVKGAINAGIHYIWVTDQSEHAVFFSDVKESYIVTNMKQVKEILKGED